MRERAREMQRTESRDITEQLVVMYINGEKALALALLLARPLLGLPRLCHVPESTETKDSRTGSREIRLNEK